MVSAPRAGSILAATSWEELNGDDKSNMDIDLEIGSDLADFVMREESNIAVVGSASEHHLDIMRD